jgi:CubicO group peptidase (beta-lactamase class C family)
MKKRLFFVVLAVGVILTAGQRGAAQEEFPFEIFGRYLKPLAQQIGMPGVSAVILQDGIVARTYNYGFADVDRQIRMTADTPVPIGGITQAMTGVLMGVCIDRFRYEIDSDIRAVVPAFPTAETSARQVLSHSTGGRFKYDPQLFTQLTPVVESPRCFTKTYREAIAGEILDRLALRRTVPGLDLMRPEGAGARALFDPAAVERYQRVLAEVATPYKIDVRGRATPSVYPSYGVDAASGVVSTVNDLADFERQLDSDDGIPLSSFTLNRMWSNQSFTFTNPNGTQFTVQMPTGLGWFVTNESGQRLVWTFGHIQDASSALIVKMTKTPPGQRPVNFTLIMLANSGGLASGYDLENANVTSSPFVKVFLRLFI